MNRCPALEEGAPDTSPPSSIFPREFQTNSPTRVLFTLALTTVATRSYSGRSASGCSMCPRPTTGHLHKEQLAIGSEWVTEQLANGPKDNDSLQGGDWPSVVLACCLLARQGQDPASPLHLMRNCGWGPSLCAPQLDAIEDFAALIRALAPGPGALQQVQAERLA
jgi:hypothetical protein